MRKIILFTQWKKFGDLLCEAFKENQWNYIFVHGGLTFEERESSLQEFEHDENIKILITTDCLSYGCNLQFADVLIHCDLLWNPQKMIQREGRVHRIGQKNVVNVITVMTEGTIEEKVYLLLKSKSDLFNQIIEDENSLKFNMDVIRKIFKDK